MQLIISGLDVSKYIQQNGFSIQKAKEYDTSNQFTAADGTEIKRCIGVKTNYSISLGNVPLNIKNLLRSRSRYGYLSCTIGTDTKSFALRNFSAQNIIQNGALNLWSVKFTLEPREIDAGSSSGGAGDYGVQCNGISYMLSKQDLIGDIKISNNCGGLPTSGIAASQLTFTINTDRNLVVYFDPSAECKVINYSAPTYYISSRRLSGSEYTITATDRTIFLDLPFNYTAFADSVDSDGNVSVANVTAAIADQAGFNGCGNGLVSSIIDKIAYADLNTSCRSILEAISQIACGTWYCADNNSLQFAALGEKHTTLTPQKNERSDILEGLVKGPMAGVMMINNSTDTEDSEVFTNGSTSSTYHAIKITSRYATAGRCELLYERIKNKKYPVFSVEKCLCNYYLPIGSTFILNDENSVYTEYTCTNIGISLSSTGAYVSVSGEISSETEWDFSGALTRQVEAQIEAGRKYHGVSIDQQNGLKCEGVGGKITMADGKITFW